MNLKFCKKCKNFLTPKEDKGKFFLACSICGFEDRSELIFSEKINHSREPFGESIQKKDIFATYHNKCKKCGYGEAEIIDMGIFYSDEDNLILLKCGKCGFSERIGRKTS